MQQLGPLAPARTRLRASIKYRPRPRHLLRARPNSDGYISHVPKNTAGWWTSGFRHRPARQLRGSAVGPRWLAEQLGISCSSAGQAPSDRDRHDERENIGAQVGRTDADVWSRSKRGKAWDTCSSVRSAVKNHEHALHRRKDRARSCQVTRDRDSLSFPRNSDSLSIALSDAPRRLASGEILRNPVFTVARGHFPIRFCGPAVCFPLICGHRVAGAPEALESGKAPYWGDFCW